MKIWLTADTHIGHANIITYCKRPFSSVEEHDEAIIHNWNSLVARNDTVYHLGDFMFSREHLPIMDTIRRLNGNIVLVRGNHDDDRLFRREDEKGNNAISLLRGYHPAGQLEIKLDHEKYFLNHYPMRSWNARHHGRLHFFGHVHTSPENPFVPEKNSYDVGVDGNNYAPILLENAIAMARKNTGPESRE